MGRPCWACSGTRVESVDQACAIAQIFPSLAGPCDGTMAACSTCRSAWEQIQKAIDVIGPLLREELRRAILRWARGKLALSPSDRFGAPPHGKIKNLKDFVAVVYDGLNAGMSPETVGGRLDLDISFVEFLRLHVRLPNGQATSVRELLTREVVPAVAMGVIEHVLMDYRLTEAESAVLNAILAEQGQESSQALVQHLNSRDHLQQVKQVVLDTLTATLAVQRSDRCTTYHATKAASSLTALGRGSMEKARRRLPNWLHSADRSP